MDRDSGLIPIGSWDTHRPDPQQLTSHELLVPRPFLDAEDADLRDECMTHALHLLDQANILRFQLVQLGDTHNHHHRFLIYGLHQNSHTLGRFGSNARSRKNQERVRTKQALAMVLINMNTDPWAFQNRTLACPAGYTARTHFQADMDKRLIDIYTEMPSPRAMDDPYLGDNVRRPSRAVERLLDQAIEQDAPQGMRTNLYQYQKNSLWKLLRRELCPDFILDPSLIPMHDMEGQAYYLDIANDGLTISRTPSAVWDDAQGGIICEDMVNGSDKWLTSNVSSRNKGTGKTCLCIALILQTLHQFSRPPSINTRLQSELYPYVPSHIISLQDEDDDGFAAPDLVLPAGSEIPSLRDLAATSVKLNGIEYRRAHDFLSPMTMSMLEDISVYYYEEETAARKRTTRTRQGNVEDQPPEIYLSSATLVIVPSNLTDQWLNEINKHTEDFALKTLEISPDPAAELPDHKTLMRYDLVLISLTKFAKEYVPGAYSKKRAKERPPCRCEELYITCRCPPPRPISPLMQVRWKRVIVDEGHSLGMKLSDHSLLAEKLHADRRWICTGTPTFNLANLQPSSGSNSAAASLSDKGDLDRLSALFGSFLHLRPYGHDKDLFAKVIQKPLVEHHNISTGVMEGKFWSLETLTSVSRLRHLMDRVMVRNKVTDVERDVTLPPLYERIVRLDLEYFQVLAINCQIALIQANAVLTERVDQDYFFHPSNRKHLARVVENLKDGCFWYPGGDDYKKQLQSALKHVQKGIQKHRETEGGKYPDEDARLLIEICDHIKRALRDHSWNAIQRTQEVGYYCKGLPRIFQGSFALIPSLELGTLVDDVEDEVDLPMGEQSGASGSVWTGSANPVALGMPAEPEEDQVCVTLAKQITHLRTEVAKHEQDMDYESVNEGNEGHHSLPVTTGGWASTNADNDRPMQTCDEGSESEAMVLERLRKARILSSTSSKLNYVISQVLRHHNSEKCIVFCQSRTAMYYIHEYLTLAKVRCRMYHTQGMTEKERSNTIMTFNTSEMVSTIIMDTKHAAFGIDLSSASRVYFVSPVWQTATMRQAVKRAHRIGQTRPVHVETLVIRNSFEEAILDRRLELDNTNRSQDTRKGKERQVDEVAGDMDLDAANSGSGISRASRSMVDDRKMRDLISHIDFMPLPTWAALTTDPPLAGGSSTSGGCGSMPLNGSSHYQQHLYSTLEDYARLDEGAPDISVSAFAVPVIFPSKHNGLAARGQPHAAGSEHVSAVDQPLALDMQQQPTEERQDEDATPEPQDLREPQDERRTVQWSFWQGDPQEPTSADDQGADLSMELNPEDVEEVDASNLDYAAQWKEVAMSEQPSGEVLEGLPTTQLNRMKLEEPEAEAEIKVEPHLELGHEVKGGGRFKTEPAPVAVWGGVKQEIKAEEDTIKQEDLRFFPIVEPEHFILFDHGDDREWKQEQEQEVMAKHEEGSVLLPLKDELAPLLATKRSPEDVARSGSALVKSEASVKRVRFC
ncbi:hypothetical protein BGZ70_010276 [Mortierella alpina]|uniref:Helicase C-terminal domain-containing protein n=1 Tax=Mortierella alpina TaxID=64518 RepID=A0A9P6JCN9_MORAP|nr:hypothetical protein BGZ70_010276 [Mortierella alpina]